jgi:glycosyltransferase involved in cell wall biosynthesis
LLGLIPRLDQIEIMKNACAVIQPSLFEGGPGGGSVTAALALDVPSICSDIPVNRELEGERVTFFKASDASDLAEKMRAALLVKPVRRSAKELLALGRKRRVECGKVLWDAVALSMQR